MPVYYALQTLGMKAALPEALLEICASIIAAVAKDKHARSHLLKMGAVGVFFSHIFFAQNQAQNKHIFILGGDLCLEFFFSCS